MTTAIEHLTTPEQAAQHHAAQHPATQHQATYNRRTGDAPFAVARHRLLGSDGSITSVGNIGYTFGGGGIGLLARRYGMAAGGAGLRPCRHGTAA